MCGFCNVWGYEYVGFEMCGCMDVWVVCMCGLRNVSVCVCVSYVMCGCLYVWGL